MVPKEVKRGRGQPKKFNAVEEMKTKIDRYFGSITQTRVKTYNKFIGIDENGKDVFEEIPQLDNNNEPVQETIWLDHPSMLGLCIYMGISKDTLSEYGMKPEYSDTIKEARKIVEKYNEGMLYRKDQVTGIIFNLKNNFGRKDKSEVDNNISGDISVNNMKDLSDEELLKLIKRK